MSIDYVNKIKKPVKNTVEYFHELGKYTVMAGKYNRLNEEHKFLITSIIIKFLPDKLTNKSGFFLKKLLKEKKITYTTLANYIAAYYIYSEGNEDVDVNMINSKLEKMLASNSFNNNNTIWEPVCNFFSVSKNMLLKGVGVRYKIDSDVLRKEAKITNVSEIDTKVEEILKSLAANISDMDSEAYIKQEYHNGFRRQIEQYQKYFADSDKVFADYVEDTFSLDKRKILKVLNSTLIDKDLFFEYITELNEEDLYVIANIIENFLSMY